MRSRCCTTGAAHYSSSSHAHGQATRSGTHAPLASPACAKALWPVVQNVRLAHMNLDVSLRHGAQLAVDVTGSGSGPTTRRDCGQAPGPWSAAKALALPGSPADFKDSAEDKP